MNLIDKLLLNLQKFDLMEIAAQNRKVGRVIVTNNGKYRIFRIR